MISAERLRELLEYNPQTGVFIWKISGPGRKKGKVAGGVDGEGYWQIGVGGRGQTRAHRLAWLYVHGEVPSRIDHRDLDKLNNRIDNLRVATGSQNKANGTAYANNKSGLKGVSYLSGRAKPWRATIQCQGKWKFLGYFDTAEAAHAKYLEAAKEAFGEFARAA
jgi:hypothetical protein